MKAIILAAGVGRRLASERPRPKCLLEFGGRTLLQRHLDALEGIGVDSVTLCVGYESDQVAAALGPRSMPKTLLVHNPRFRLGSIVSLWTARGTLLGGDDVLVMDADVLYHPDMLKRLALSEHRNCWLMDRDFAPGDEPVKICMDGSRIVEFRKHIDSALTYTDIGESVGFFRFDPAAATRLAGIAAAWCASGRGDEPHEEALRALALDSPGLIGVEDATGIPWIEIDFPEDVERAATQILPLIHGN